MGLLTTAIFGERRALEKTFVENPAQWLIDMFGGRAAATGINVTEQTAMQAPAVFSSVAAVAETIGSLPLFVYRRLEDGGKEIDTAHALHERIHLSPNPEMTSMQWRELKQAHLMLNGNAYSEIVRNGAGRVVALWPIHPQRMDVARQRGELVYTVTVPGGAVSVPGQPIRDAQRIALRPDQVLHIRALTLDGVLGLSRLKLHRESIGLSIALEEYGARFFGNGAEPAAVLEHPGRLGPEATKQLRTSWEQMHGGLTNAHRVAILEEGMKLHAFGVQNERAQFLESRSFQVGESARIFRVPGVLIGHNDKTATYASAEQFFLAYVVHTIRPWTVRWEQWLMLGLLTPQERRTHVIEHKIDGLLRGDAQTRAQALQIQFQHGALSIDEWRAIENRNPLPDGLGQQHFVPLNMVPVDQAGQDRESGAAAGLRAALRQFLEASAARALRRELEAVRRAAMTHARDPKAWREWVHEFYGEHAVYLTEALQLDPDAARAWAATRRAAVLEAGLAAAARWEAEGTGALIENALARLSRPPAAMGGHP